MRPSGLQTLLRRGAHRVPATLALLTLGCLAPGAAYANSHSHTEYSLSIVEGESTLPEEVLAHVSASVSPDAQVVLTITRGGTVIYRNEGSQGAWLSQVPQVGDTVAMESPAGHVVGSVVYDGLPSLDPTVCAGSESFSGQRSGAMEVTGGYYTLVQVTDPYGNVHVHHGSSGQAQVTTQVGQSFAGNFLSPLQTGETVWASETVTSQLAGEATFTYASEYDRPVGTCPAPQPPPPPPPPPPALQGSIFKFAHMTIQKLMKFGFSDQVTINQPGTIIQDMYLENGKVPAVASSLDNKSHHKHHKPPALLIARGSAQASASGTVTVSLKLTNAGRRKLKHMHGAKVELVTTLHATSGAKLNLQPRTVAFHH
jgi:hypothetical protein